MAAVSPEQLLRTIFRALGAEAMQVATWEATLTQPWRKLLRETILRHFETPKDTVTIKVPGVDGDWWSTIVVAAHVDAAGTLHVKADVTMRPESMGLVGISVQVE